MDDNKLQQQIVQLVWAAMQGNKQAQQRVQQIMQAAQQGDQQAAQIAQMIQQVAKQMQQQQVQAAKFGAKLNYIRQLNGKCPDGYEMQYFKQGGRVCKKCVAKQSQNPVDSFRCGRKLQNGGKQPNDSYDNLTKFGKSLVSGVGMTGIGAAGANVDKVLVRSAPSVDSVEKKDNRTIAEETNQYIVKPNLSKESLQNPFTNPVNYDPTFNLALERSLNPRFLVKAGADILKKNKSK